MSRDRSRAWLPRATTQFARTVYTELRRAGHGKGDVLRFINELMDMLSGETERIPDTPELVEPEAGLPTSDTMHDIVEFELRIRPKDRRKEERLAIAAIDVVLPAWTAVSAKQRTHELLFDAVSQSLRAGDSLGRLGPDRYLLVLPRTKRAVCASIEARVAKALDPSHLADGLSLEFRWAVVGDPEPASAVEMLQLCFAATPSIVRPTVGTRAPAKPPRETVPVHATRELVLALGGGAARAVSHAGMLSVLLAADVRPLAVAGCSAGGLVGAMVALGVEPEAMIGRFVEFSKTSIYLEMRRAYASFLRETRAAGNRSRTRYFGASSLVFYSDSALSALSNDHLAAFVEHFVGKDRNIAELRMPFAVVATDLVEGVPVKLSHGSLHAALAASCAVPGLFPPQRLGERLFVDGSTVTEVPIWAAQLFGLAAPVLAVYMGRPFHRIADYQTSTEVSSRSGALIHAELVREQLRRAELLLTIPMEDVGWLDFRQAKKIVEIGRNATQAALPRILERFAR